MERWSGSGTQPRKGPWLSFFGAFGEKRKVAVKTKAVAILLCPTKRSGLSQSGPCGQPLGVLPKVEEALFFPYGSGPSMEFPVLPPELVSNKHWTHCQAPWRACPDARGLATGPVGACGLVGGREE